MCGRYKMGRRYLAGDMLEPAPRAPQSGSAQRSVQGIPVSPCLLLRCCFLVAVKGLRFSISLPFFLVFCLLCRCLVLFSPCCPLLSGSRLSAVHPCSAFTRVGPDLLRVGLPAACGFAFLKKVRKEIKEFTQSLSILRSRARLKVVNWGMCTGKSAKTDAGNISLPWQKFDQTQQIWVKPS